MEVELRSAFQWKVKLAALPLTACLLRKPFTCLACQQFYLLVSTGLLLFLPCSIFSSTLVIGNTDVSALDFQSFMFRFNLKPEGSITKTICDILCVTTYHHFSCPTMLMEWLPNWGNWYWVYFYLSHHQDPRMYVIRTTYIHIHGDDMTEQGRHYWHGNCYQTLPPHVHLPTLLDFWTILVYDKFSYFFGWFKCYF